jgi:hypothetical protein
MSSRACTRLRLPERLPEIVEEIVKALDADRKAHEIPGHLQW